MTPRELADREEIRQLMARYNMAGDRGDIAALADAFAADGTLAFNGRASTGRAAIITRLTGGPPRDPALTVVRHHLATSLIHIAGDAATGRTYFTVFTDIGPDHHGLYVDRFERIEGAWAIRHREVRIDWQSERSLVARQHVRGRPPE